MTKPVSGEPSVQVPSSGVGKETDEERKTNGAALKSLYNFSIPRAGKALERDRVTQEADKGKRSATGDDDCERVKRGREEGNRFSPVRAPSPDRGGSTAVDSRDRGRSSSSDRRGDRDHRTRYDDYRSSSLDRRGDRDHRTRYDDYRSSSSDRRGDRDHRTRYDDDRSSSSVSGSRKETENDKTRSPLMRSLPIQSRPDAPYITYIRNKEKTAECRIFSGGVTNFKVGDHLKLYNHQEGIICEITFLHKYESFRKMVETEGAHNILPQLKKTGLKGEDLIKKAISVYEAFPGSERVRSYGCIAIGVKYLKEVDRQK